MNASKRLARIAGILYLLVGLLGGFAQGFVYPRVSAATAGHVLANAGLVRLGVVADLFQATVFVFLALTLYRLLKHVHQSVAGAMVVLVAIAAGVTCLNAIFEFSALRVAIDAVYLSALGADGSNALVLLLVDAHHYGLLAAQIFFGLWLPPLGYLAYTSGWFPRALGVMPIAGRLLPREPARGIPDPRRRPTDPRLHRHPVGNRGDLNRRLPARDRGEGRKAGARPHRGTRAAIGSAQGALTSSALR